MTTIKQEVQIELASRGIVGRDNSDVIERAQNENQMFRSVWDKESEPGLLKVILGLVFGGKGESK